MSKGTLECDDGKLPTQTEMEAKKFRGILQLCGKVLPAVMYRPSVSPNFSTPHPYILFHNPSQVKSLQAMVCGNVYGVWQYVWCVAMCMVCGNMYGVW
jgi:hypothetical protein